MDGFEYKYKYTVKLSKKIKIILYTVHILTIINTKHDT